MLCQLGKNKTETHALQFGKMKIFQYEIRKNVQKENNNHHVARSSGFSAAIADRPHIAISLDYYMVLS